MSKKKIYVVGSATNYACWIENSQLTYNMNEADIVLFTGGSDVDPSFYGREKDPSTYSNIVRDREEQREFDRAIELKVPLIMGICRGLQYINVMHGGIMIQDVTHHAMGATHGMTNGEELYEINSLHHQMVYPYNIKDYKYDILYWADPPRSRHYYGITPEELNELKCEPEVVLYHTNEHTKCLGIQGHPEMLHWRDQYHPTLDMLNKLVNKYLYVK
jgi:gamma-glutamyl-gamma-aminobutyrate hydrolase PuuD